MAKKIFLVLGFLLVIIFPAFSNILTNISQWNFKLLDMPLIDGMLYFAASIGSFVGAAQVFANILALICILWNAFRLWFGTQEVRKACVDIIMKFLLFIVLMNIYPSIVTGVIDVSMQIGLKAGNGYVMINEEFKRLKELSLAKVKIAQEYVIKTLTDNDVVLRAEEIKELAKTVYMGESEFRAFMQENGIDEWSKETYDSKGRNSSGFFGAIYDIMFPTEEQKQYYAASRNFQTQISEEIGMNLSADAGDRKNAMVTMKALQEVLIETKVDDPNNPGNKVTQYMYNPFIEEGVSGTKKFTMLLSPGAMIKTSVMIAEIISRQGSIDYVSPDTITESEFVVDEEGLKEIKTEKGKGFLAKKFDATFNNILQFILTCLMSFGIVASACFFCVQYCMCIFEYYIVTSVGYIFVPFCLWDGTKSYTAKLVTLFSAFFIKILVTVLCIMFSFSMFIRMGTDIVNGTNPISLMSFAHFIFTTLLCWVVTQNAPQIAVTILNGSPQLSMGEFMQAAGTAAGAAIGAKKAAQAGHQALQGTVRAGQGAVSTFKGAGAAYNKTKESGGSTGSALGNAAAYTGLSALKGIGNRLGEFATGQQKKDDKGIGRGNDPEKNSSTNNQTMYRDAVDTKKKDGETFVVDRQAKKEAEQNSPKPPEKNDNGLGDSGTNQRE